MFDPVRLNFCGLSEFPNARTQLNATNHRSLNEKNFFFFEKSTDENNMIENAYELSRIARVECSTNIETAQI